jgi:hypothetical protein
MSFYASDQANARKMWANSEDHLSRLLHFAHIQVAGWGGRRGWGESQQTAQTSVHGKNATVYSLIVSLTDL